MLQFLVETKKGAVQIDQVLPNLFVQNGYRNRFSYGIEPFLSWFSVSTPEDLLGTVFG